MTTNNSKIILEAENIPLVDLNFMNNTHFEEIQMVKDLGQLVSAYENKETHTDEETANITQRLKEWYQHTSAHFERENDLMRETAFPAYRIHSAEHSNALNAMDAIIQQWNDTNDIATVSHYLFNHWPNWFNGHVNTMDMMTANFALMNGFDANDTPPA